MKAHPTFRAFFSYAHHDDETDPRIIKAFTVHLEKRVNAKLVNARFEVWKDKDGLRTGDKWESKLEEVLRDSHVLIILLTPKWVESDFCRKEFSIFEEVEDKRVGYYVVPILARDIDKQKQFFTADQLSIFGRVSERQCKRILAVQFYKTSDANKTGFVDALADDIEGMIERLRTAAPPDTEVKIKKTARGLPKEFNLAAHNFENVDVIKDSEVVFRRQKNGNPEIYAQVDFFERLYVQGDRGRIEFGVRRAFLSIGNVGSGKLSKVAELSGTSKDKNVYYVSLHDAPDNINVCIDPLDGKSTMADLALPPAKGENRLSKIVIASSDTNSEHLTAHLTLLLNAEGLHVVGESNHPISPRVQSKIRATWTRRQGR